MIEADDYGYGDGFGDGDGSGGDGGIEPENMHMRPNAPTQQSLADAFERGTPIVFGRPVKAVEDDQTHLLNLVAAQRGDPDPYWTTRVTHDGTVVDMAHAGDRGLYVRGQAVTRGDVSRVDAALAAAPAEDERHTDAGEAKRRQAGRLAMQIRDAHVRAELLTLVDGWEAMADEQIDASETDGELFSVVDGEDGEIDARLLIVTCPSTARRYAHLVPSSVVTAKAARQWMMGTDATPDVET